MNPEFFLVAVCIIVGRNIRLPQLGISAIHSEAWSTCRESSTATSSFLCIESFDGQELMNLLTVSTSYSESDEIVRNMRCFHQVDLQGKCLYWQ